MFTKCEFTETAITTTDTMETTMTIPCAMEKIVCNTNDFYGSNIFIATEGERERP